jgi:hypothetical protein
MSPSELATVKKARGNLSKVECGDFKAMAVIYHAIGLLDALIEQGEDKGK